MAHFVYILCAISSGACTWFLFNHYRKTRVPLLFWSGIAFLAFTVTNALLFVDLVLFPDVDLILVRNSATLMGVIVLLYGLIFKKQ